MGVEVAVLIPLREPNSFAIRISHRIELVNVIGVLQKHAHQIKVEVQAI